MISEEEKEQVRNATDVLGLVGETVELRRKGSSYWGCCPFHHEKSPSFHVNPQTGLWKCFGCGKGGDIFAYVMEREHLDFPDAIRYLADRANIELHEDAATPGRGPRKKDLYAALEDAQLYYHQMLMRGVSAQADEARKYLASRGFNSRVCKKWRLGFAPGMQKLMAAMTAKGHTLSQLDKANLVMRGSRGYQDRFFNRVMFPIHDEQGRCIGFGGRVMGDGKPKYLNTSETAVFHKSKNMFAFDKAKETIVAKKCAVVVEGYTDVISLHEAGFTNVVATLGTALTLEHVQLLSRFADTIIFMFDGDAAGQKAAERAIKFVDKTQADLRCTILPDNLDPQEFVMAKGPKALEARLEAARPLMDFVFEIRMGRYDLEVPGQFLAAFNSMAQLLSVFKDSLLLDVYATRLADAFRVDVDKARAAIQKAQTDAVFSDSEGLGHVVSASRAKATGKDLPAPSYEPYGGPREDAYPQDGLADASVYGYSQPCSDTDAGQDIHGGASAYQVSTLSREDQQQVRAEAELLGLMCEKPYILNRYPGIRKIKWVLPQHGIIAQAMLEEAQTGGVDIEPRRLVSVATKALPQAPQILSSAEMITKIQWDTDKKVQFLLMNIELSMTQRKIRDNKAVMSRTGDSASASQLLAEGVQLQKHMKDLNDALTLLASEA